VSSADQRSAGERRYRMKELCELTGLSRQAIHFYVQQGLLPPGHKTGRNMAYYDERHLERLQLIRKLQHEQFLPLKAIRAVLEGETRGFDRTQRNMLRQLKARLTSSELRRAARPEFIDAAAAAERSGVSLADVRTMASEGLVAADGDGDELRISSEDAWLVEMWGQCRALGFTEESGFSVKDMSVYAEFFNELFDRERQMLVGRLAAMPPDRVASMLQNALPLIHAFFARYHTAQVRNFFAALE